MLEPILTERLPPAIAAHLAYVIRTFADDLTTEPSHTFLVELESAYDEGEDEYSRAKHLTHPACDAQHVLHRDRSLSGIFNVAFIAQIR